MRLLRILLIIYALLTFIGGVILFKHMSSGWYILIPLDLSLNAIIVLFAVVFEKGRYRSKSKITDDFQPTNERFIDPGTHKLMQVYYNPKNGERIYREVRNKKS